MNSKPWILCLGCAVAGFALSNPSQPQLIGQDKEKDQGRVKWEYHVQTELDAKRLNNLGEQGWDLVAVTPREQGEGRTFYLRRSKL